MHRCAIRSLCGLLALGLAFAVTACGGDDDSGTPSVPDTLPPGAVVVAAADITFPVTEFMAAAGDVTIQYVNDPGVIPHSLVIEGVDKGDFYLEISGAGDTDTGTVALTAATYTIFCDLPAHRGAGMEGTLTVA